jgi:hypothetical protein
MTVSENFKSAIKDYLYLLERDYPQKASLKIISDRYTLSGEERSIMLRGVSDKNTSKIRELKLVKEKNLAGKLLAIDFYNVAFTVQSYLAGITLYISTDGLLRDSGEYRGKIKNEKSFYKAAGLIINYLTGSNTKYFILYLDSPVGKSGEMAAYLSDIISKNEMHGEALCVKSADYCIINNKADIAATSDSIIINKSNRVFDLAFFIIKRFYKAKFVILKKIIREVNR